MRYRVSHAQNREDVILKGFFPDVKNGFYVDVGASHPDEYSVTKLFYEEGWNGINIEPIPRLFKLLNSRRSRDINLNMGVSDAKSALNFREYVSGDGLSTFSKEVQENYKSTPNTVGHTEKFKDYKVNVFPLKDVFADQKVKDINFMKVDV